MFLFLTLKNYEIALILEIVSVDHKLPVVGIYLQSQTYFS